MAKQKNLDEIKHGSEVLQAIQQGIVFFSDFSTYVSLDTKVLQMTLNRLLKNGYIRKNGTRWTADL